MEIINQCLIWLEANSMRWTSYSACWSRSIVSIAQGVWKKKTLLVLKKKVTIKWHLMVFCYTQRWVPGLAIIRETSSCSRWENDTHQFSSFRAHRTLWKSRQKEWGRQGMEDTRITRLSNNKWTKLRWTQRAKEQSQDVQGST